MTSPVRKRIARRSVLAAGTGLAGLALARSFGWIGGPARARTLLSATDDAARRHHVTGIDLGSGARFSVPVEQRCHEIVPDPADARRAIVVARRPGTLLFELDLAGRAIVRKVASPPDRHVYGHACFDPDGGLLYVPENDFARARGVVGVYDGRNLARLGEIPSHGVGPHAIALRPDGDTLVVANGGIHTHPAHDRRPLNLATMDPSLAYVSASSGRLVESFRLADHSAGIRHLAVAAGGEVAVAIQYEGMVGHTGPLLAYRPGAGELRAAGAPERVARAMRAYAASVALDAGRGVAGITCPRGDLVAFFDTSSGELRKALPIRDAGGILLEPGERHFLISTGFGELHRIDAATFEPTSGSPVRFEGLRFDNHVVVV
jgi:hypothetical protein